MSKTETNNARKKRVKRILSIMDADFIKNGKHNRSFAEIDADIELRNWTERYHPTPLEQVKPKPNE